MNDKELGQTHLVQHEIDTGDTLPLKISPHRLAPGKITLVKKEIEDMLALSDNQTARTVHQSFSLPKRMGAIKCAHTSDD